MNHPSQDIPLLPVRIINEYVYCPRLAYLMWVQSEWSESADTVDGRFVHRQVDQPGGDLPQAPREDETIHARSVTLSSETLGVIAKLDLIEGEGRQVTPVDYKRGKRPHSPTGVRAPERVQLCLQGLLLREHGYETAQGVIYYAASRERVPVAFDDTLEAEARTALTGLRKMATDGVMPPPLEDSPKCPRCALVGICLPDEVRFLRGEGSPLRPLAVSAEPVMPLYVQAPYSKVGLEGETLRIEVKGREPQTARLGELSQVALFGNAIVTTPALHELMSRGIPVSWHSEGGWFHGHTIGTGHGNVELRTAQYQASFDPDRCLEVARGLVEAKILNCRTLLRRNWKDGTAPKAVLDGLKRDAENSRTAAGLESLLGVEGSGAARYFGEFANMIRLTARQGGEEFDFDFRSRNRRPPRDPVNALLSFGYALLARTWLVTLSGVGFDPYRGFYHQPRYGRPALALDLMEPFRPLIVDSAVIQAINNGEVQPKDFVRNAGAVSLKGDGRKRFIAAFERRLSQEVTHPLFGYRLSYRRLLEVQARLFGRYLLGELPQYPNFTTR